MHGNIAASFLFNKEKEQLGEILYKKTRETEKADSDEDEKIDKEKIQGYFTTKHKYTLGNVNDFISKMRKTGVLSKFFSQSEPAWCGLQ